MISNNLFNISPFHQFPGQFLLSEDESEIDIEDDLSGTTTEQFDNGSKSEVGDSGNEDQWYIVSESEDESGSEEQWDSDSEDYDGDDESGSEIV